jgi:chloride channel 7
MRESPTGVSRTLYCKKCRFLEVIAVSTMVSVISFLLPLIWVKCTPLPIDPEPQQDADLLSELVSFRCKAGEEYNELASLMFTEPGVAIRQLFHLHKHAFSDAALFVFFLSYISMAVIVYGIAIPSGLFVPSLLSGATFGRLFGNLLHKVHKDIAFSNTYALVGAAALLGGMARMTISLTVILLECTGNEQFVLPLMLTLMTARLVGGLFNDDLYHIHIHLKKGVQFLEAELKSITRHHEYVGLLKLPARWYSIRLPPLTFSLSPVASHLRCFY